MSSREPHPTSEELEGYALGALEEPLAASVEAHLAGCPACQQSLIAAPEDTLVNLLRSAQSLLPPPETPAEAPTAVHRADSFLDPPAPADGARSLGDHPRYRLIRLLGEGGMGSVWLAEHRVMQRPVALKRIRAGCFASARSIDRFRREMRAAACLDHPNIVRAFDADEAGSERFLVMEYVEGEPLSEVLARRGRLGVAEACDYVRQAALGLQYAHEHGMVHRDIKPHNLILTRDGQVKVLDFGLARFVHEGEAAEDDQRTAEGTIMGTPDYLSPEQASDSRSADVRADIYSLGCTLFQLLTGQVPFPGGSGVDKLVKHRTERPLSLARLRPDAPPALVGVVGRMMAKDPAQRYQTPAEVIEALDAVLAQRPPPARRRWRLILVCLAPLLLVAALAVYRIQTDKGELVITTESDDVEVLIKQGGKEVRVVDTRSDKQITLVLRSGVYELELKGAPEGLMLDVEKVALRRGQQTLARIERVPGKPAQHKVGLVFRRRWSEAPFASGVDLSPDGRLLLSMHWGGVRVWEVSSGKVVHEWPGWLGQFTPDGKKIVTTTGRGDPAGDLALYETDGGKLLRKFGRHPQGVSGLATCPNGRFAFTGSADGVNRLWDLTTGKLVKSTPKDDVEQDVWGGKEVPAFQRRTGVYPEYVLPGGREVMGRHLVDERAVAIYDLGSGQIVRKIPLAAGPVEALGTSGAYGRRFGRRMAVSLSDGSVCVLDLVEGKEVIRLSAGNFQPSRMAISADDRFLAACAANEKSDVVVWRLPDPPAAKDKP